MQNESVEQMEKHEVIYGKVEFSKTETSKRNNLLTLTPSQALLREAHSPADAGGLQTTVHFHFKNVRKRVDDKEKQK